jgi:hypothetical protein
MVLNCSYPVPVMTDEDFWSCWEQLPLLDAARIERDLEKGGYYE